MSINQQGFKWEHRNRSATEQMSFCLKTQTAESKAKPVKKTTIATFLLKLLFVHGRQVRLIRDGKGGRGRVPMSE